MTRSQFLEESSAWDWGELLSFCSDYELNACEDIVYSDNLDMYICDDIRSALSQDYWYEIRDALDGIDRDGCYYRREGTLEYYIVDDDIDAYLDDVLDEMDENDLWENEEDDEEETYEEDEEDEGFFCDPEPLDEVDKTLAEGVFSVADFMASQSAEIAVIRETEAERAERAKRALEEASAAHKRLAEEQKKREADLANEFLDGLNDLIASSIG